MASVAAAALRASPFTKPPSEPIVEEWAVDLTDKGVARRGGVSLPPSERYPEASIPLAHSSSTSAPASAPSPAATEEEAEPLDIYAPMEPDADRRIVFNAEYTSAIAAARTKLQAIGMYSRGYKRMGRLQTSLSGYSPHTRRLGSS